MIAEEAPESMLNRVIGHFGYIVLHFGVPMKIGEVVPDFWFRASTHYEAIQQPMRLVAASSAEEAEEQFRYLGDSRDFGDCPGLYFYRAITD